MGKYARGKNKPQIKAKGKIIYPKYPDGSKFDQKESDRIFKEAVARKSAEVVQVGIAIFFLPVLVGMLAIISYLAIS